MRRRSLGLFIRVKSAGKVETDYTKFLKVGSLKGARIGVLRGYMGQNAETDRRTTIISRCWNRWAILTAPTAAQRSS